MIEDLEDERVLEELQDGDHPRDVVEHTLEEGAPDDYKNPGELLTDISTAVQKIEDRDDIEETRDRAPGLVEEYCSKLYLTDGALSQGKTILDNLNRETYSRHEADAIAGASTYVGSIFSNEKVTIDEVERVGEIGSSRFRSAYKDVKSQVIKD